MRSPLQRIEMASACHPTRIGSLAPMSTNSVTYWLKSLVNWKCDPWLESGKTISSAFGRFCYRM